MVAKVGSAQLPIIRISSTMMFPKSSLPPTLSSRIGTNAIGLVPSTMPKRVGSSMKN